MKHVKLFEQFFSEREVSSEEREKLADKGFALPDGSYPIANVEDLKNAVSAFGRSNPEKRKAVAQHIEKRAKALGKEDLIPQTEIFQKALQESINEEIDIHDRLTDLMNKLQVQIGNLQQEAKGDKDWTKALSGIKSSFDQLEDKISIAAKKLGVINEGVVSIKGGRILAHKVLNKLVDMEVIPVKKKTEDLVETIASLLASASLNEETLEENSQAMVQIAGKSKPSGAQVLATVIVDHMMDNQYLKPGADKVKKELISDLQKLIMDSTF